MAISCATATNSHSVAIGTLKDSVAHAFLSLPAGDPIFKPKIKQRVYYVFAFRARWRLDRGAKIRRQRALGHGVYKTTNMRRVHIQQ